jgi:isoleucyl-tRNA synthetase
VRKVLLTYWNTASFLVLYANANHWVPGEKPAPAVGDRPLLDRWVLSELHRLVGEVDAALEDFDSARAGRALAAFVDDLSNWYVRRSRRRFWDGDPAALTTLHDCLEVVTRLLAPFVPFLADEVHERLVCDVWPDVPNSVHLREWPERDASLVDDTLSTQMTVVRRVVELGRAARATSKVKNRQPLASIAVYSPDWDGLPEQLKDLVLDELNVMAAATLDDTATVVHRVVKPNFRNLGKKFGARTKEVAAAVAAAPAGVLVDAVRSGSPVDLAGDQVVLEAADVIVTETPAEGWATATEPGLTVALDLRITDELRRAGLVREAIRLVQEARKSQGFDVSDRIELWWRSGGEMGEALHAGAAALADEVLAVSLTEGEPAAPLAAHEVPEHDLTFWLRVVD